MARRRKCAHVPCGEMFEARCSTHRYCSPSCSTSSRGAAWFAERTRKSAATRKAKGYSRVLAKLKAAGVTDAGLDVCRVEFERRYAAGHAQGTAQGYRKGWAEALGENDYRDDAKRRGTRGRAA